MHDQMTQSEQLKWVLKETGRQLAAPYHLAEIFFEKTNIAIYDFRASRLQNRKIRNLLERLTDDTLLDRLANAPTQIPVTANDEPVSIPVRFKIRRLSIDGILAR